jgi:hypothetical protein
VCFIVSFCLCTTLHRKSQKKLYTFRCPIALRAAIFVCHHWHGMGHFQRDCPSKKSYIAIADSSYVSASDTEDDLALQTNHAGDLADDDDDEQVFGSEQTIEYSTKTYVMQQVLSVHMDQSEKFQ